MKFGEAKSYWAIFVLFLILAWSSMGQTQKQKDCPDGRGGGNPSWFKPGKSCTYKQRPYHYDAAGGIYINSEQRRCKEVILVCGIELKRESVVNKDPGCGGPFWPDAKDGDEVCCDEFQKAIISKQPCDPSKDADCDGIPNVDDSNPFNADPPTDPAADNKCKQLDFDVYTAYRKAGAKGDTATDAGHAAQQDCIKRRTDKLCGIPTPNTPVDPAIYFPDPDRDDKCKQLAFEVYEAYKKAGANVNTAFAASESAKYDCLKRRASKLKS